MTGGRIVPGFFAAQAIAWQLLAAPAPELLYSNLKALAASARSIPLELVYNGQENIETASSILSSHKFQHATGVHVYVLGSELFRINGSYLLELRFMGFAVNGKPYAELVGRAVSDSYAGDIVENDPRVAELKKDLMQGKTLPEKIKLFFGRAEGDYLAFYDFEGREIWYRYREDRFDLEAQKTLHELIQGQAYLVEGDFEGLLLHNRFIARSASDYGEALKQNDSLLVLSFSGAYPLRMDQLLLQ